MQIASVLTAFLVAALLAGCTASPLPDPHHVACPDGYMHPAPYDCPGATFSPTTAPPSPQPAERMSIHGIVVDEALQPVGGATVLLIELGTNVSTGPAGTFRFEDLVPTTYFLRASAPEHDTQTLSVDPRSAQDAVRFQLAALRVTASDPVPVHFVGHIQCALEVFIVTPSCDSVITYAGGPALFNSTATAFLPVDANWKTVVADLVFDPAEQPGVNGLRSTVRGTYSQDSLGTYEDYGSFNGSSSFTFRVEPGQTYPNGNTVVPGNLTQFQFDVYPQSWGWHATCEPPFPQEPDNCALGLGVGVDIRFDLYLTTFYGEPAPEGWTLQA